MKDLKMVIPDREMKQNKKQEKKQVTVNYEDDH